MTVGDLRRAAALVSLQFWWDRRGSLIATVLALAAIVTAWVR
jgi:hypothetical protein